MTELRRTLGLGQCVFFGVGSILGAGIYALLGKVAGEAGNMVWLSFFIASLTAFFTAFSYAELSAAFPKTGGEYVYVRKAFGEKLGLVLGCGISLTSILSGATVALGFAGYFSKLLEAPELISALGIIGLIFLVNASGIRESSWVNTIFTLIEAGGLFFVVYSAWPSLGEADFFELPEGGAHGIVSAAALGFFAYIGFEDIVKLAEEAKKPEKTIPKALFISNGIVMIIYTLVAVCAVSAISADQLGNSGSPLADVVDKRFGTAAVTAIVIIALFATANTILSNMLSSSRVLLNIAQDQPRLKRFAAVSKKRRTPIAALLLVFALMCAFSLIGEIETVAQIANLFIFGTFFFVNLSAVVLRVKEKNLERPFKIPLNIGNIPVPSLLGMLMTLALLGYNMHSLVVKGIAGS